MLALLALGLLATTCTAVPAGTIGSLEEKVANGLFRREVRNHPPLLLNEV
jgi:hypothetical protein